MEILKKRNVLKKRGIVFFFARIISNWGYRRLTHAHVEFAEDLKSLKKMASVFLYTGLHRSLWETSGMLSALYYSKLPVPVVGMGDNLIKGKLFVTLAKNTSVFLVKRGKTRKEIVDSAKELKKYMYSFMSYGKDVLLFPEGTRTNIPRNGQYGGFFPTAFDALIEYEKDRPDIQKNGIDQTYDSFIVPFNCDYSVIREAWELAGYGSGTPLTLRIWDSLKMLKHIKDVYVSFGAPVKISDHLNKSRKEVATLIREKCMDLVKILPVNVVARAVVESHKENRTERSAIIKKIDEVLSKLKSHTNRFMGFPDNFSPETLYKHVSESNSDFKFISPGKLPIYKLYSDYINHYFS